MERNHSDVMNTTAKMPFRYPYDRYFRAFLVYMIIFNSITAVVATVFNFLIVMTFLATSCIRTNQNILVLGLAMSDFCVGLYVQPLFCVHLYGVLVDNIELAETSDAIFFASFTMLSMVSLGNLTAVTFDRYLAVYLHLRYHELVTVKRNSVTIALIWIICSVVCLIRVLTNNYEIVLIDIFLFVAALTLNSFLLFKISQAIHKHTIQIHAQNTVAEPSINMPRYKRSIKTMYLVTTAFVLCYCPYVVALTYVLIVQEWTQNVSYMFAVFNTLMMINGVVNPVIYCWRVGEIRIAVYRFVGKLIHR